MPAVLINIVICNDIHSDQSRITLNRLELVSWEHDLQCKLRIPSIDFVIDVTSTGLDLK